MVIVKQIIDSVKKGWFDIDENTFPIVTLNLGVILFFVLGGALEFVLYQDIYKIIMSSGYVLFFYLFLRISSTQIKNMSVLGFIISMVVIFIIKDYLAFKIIVALCILFDFLMLFTNKKYRRRELFNANMSFMSIKNMFSKQNIAVDMNAVAEVAGEEIESILKEIGINMDEKEVFVEKNVEIKQFLSKFMAGRMFAIADEDIDDIVFIFVKENLEMLFKRIPDEVYVSNAEVRFTYLEGASLIVFKYTPSQPGYLKTTTVFNGKTHYDDVLILHENANIELFKFFKKIRQN